MQAFRRKALSSWAPASYLADVDGRVQGLADIHAHVRPKQVPVAGERIQLDLAARRAEREIVER